MDYSRGNTIASIKEDDSPRRLNSLGNTDLLLSRRATLAPLSTRNHKAATTSGVSATESKLIIALRRQLQDAKHLLEKDHFMKLRLVEGARDLKSQLVEALSS